MGKRKMKIANDVGQLFSNADQPVIAQKVKGNLITFENGSKIEFVTSDKVIRGRGYFIGMDLAKEESK